MCGIFGWLPSDIYINVDFNKVADKLISSMKNRGPDDSGYVILGKNSHSNPRKLMIGHTRLSIVDLSYYNHQPMVTYDNRIWITFNGEIYNYKNLRKKLKKLGYTFFTNGDTEVLLNAYVEWGEKCLDYLLGMFSFCVYDSKKNILFCARDQFGIKPFFWSLGSNGFCFSSEIISLLEFPGIDRYINIQQAYNFLVFADVEVSQETMIKGVNRLLPSHYILIDLNKINSYNQNTIRDALYIKKYWDLPLQKKSISFFDAVQELREIFLKNVQMHLACEVPIGVALSGGIDSTGLACAVRYLNPDIPLHTFSYIADESSISESKWITKASKACNSFSHTTMPNANTFVKDIDNLVKRMGEPFRTTSIYAQYSVMKLAHDHGIKVILEGQGPDEMFGGYTSHISRRVATLLKLGHTELAIDFISNAASWPGRESAISDSLRLCGIIPNRLIKNQVKNQVPFHLLLKLKKLYDLGVTVFQGHENPYSSDSDELRKFLAFSCTHSGIPGLMRHGDRNAMTFSIENRVPFITPEMVSFALSLPEDYLISQSGCSKFILREALRGLVPDDLLNRRDKIGFEAPGLPWLSKILPWVLKNFLESRSFFIDTKVLTMIWKEVLYGKRQFDWGYWRLLSYIRWKDLLSLKEY